MLLAGPATGVPLKAATEHCQTGDTNSPRRHKASISQKHKCGAAEDPEERKGTSCCEIKKGFVKDVLLGAVPVAMNSIPSMSRVAAGGRGYGGRGQAREAPGMNMRIPDQ